MIPIVVDEKDSALPDRVPLRTRDGFGAFVHASRIRLGLTQERLAQTVGKSRRWLQDVEQGKVAPSVSAAMDLAAALGYDFVAERSKPSPVLDQVFADLP